MTPHNKNTILGRISNIILVTTVAYRHKQNIYNLCTEITFSANFLLHFKSIRGKMKMGQRLYSYLITNEKLKMIIKDMAL